MVLGLMRESVGIVGAPMDRVGEKRNEVLYDKRNEVIFRYLF